MNADCRDLNALGAVLTDRADLVEDLLAYHRSQVICPVTGSVDIRRNRHKAAVVDANAFPAGFNNLAARSVMDATQAVRNYLGRLYPTAKRILVVAESHTRNAHYFESLRILQQILVDAGYDVRLGTLNPDLGQAANVTTSTGGSITLHAIERQGDRLGVDGQVADVVVLNNDLADGEPKILRGLAQPVTPPALLGWHRRRKSQHFAIVADLARQLGAYAGFDPWLISAGFETVEGLDFKAQAGLDRVAAAIDRVIAATQAKYDEYGIKRLPSVFVKADTGTYGMAITTAKSGTAFLQSLNSRARQEMDMGKGRVKTTAVIVQETIPSEVRAGHWVAEPVVYMVCGRAIGGFHRVHEAKSDTDNLNAPGSRFEPLAFLPNAADGARPGSDETVLDACSAHVYTTLGELASIATGYEAKFAVQPGIVPQYP